MNARNQRRKGSRRRRGWTWICASLALVGASGCGPADTPTPPPPQIRLAPPVAQVQLVWPTPNPAFSEGQPIERFVQPTESGIVTSGLFGSVRSGGRQFHEGLDLFPLQRDRHGEATDDIRAALAGVVRHVSAKAGASSYGRYLVLEHPAQSPPVYTLYAHLAAIEPGIAPGVTVSAGARLGQMGRSAGGYTIPKDRAHLHFEIGLRLTDSFAAWYKRRGFGSPNPHGLYNGMNLLGVDPLAVFARRENAALPDLDTFFRELPTAVRLRIAHPAEPDFTRRYPSLVQTDIGAAARGGWEIEFSVTAVPVRWRARPVADFAGWKAGEVQILMTDSGLLDKNRGRDLVDQRRGMAVPGDDLSTVLQLLFDWRG